ncbi:interferon regulatory factor 9 isoform X3 [Zalophus californianus]|uniref:Interferon regulatory factor 9 n=1 Tax=Zalophus californianus TaxID=9704 RepID=A0A6J2BF69_ZALCA|nr:interferon regulatory factor 9 isoform X3 [Zalophus californianus]
MASGRARCTRKLRNWVVEQVESGQFPGVCWDDAAKTMFRIPWKHAGKQDFREDQDAAFFKAWAIFKGKFKEGDTEGPAIWKTRLRCAFNKSPEFEEVPENAHRDGAEPYKVYRLLPPSGTLPGTDTTEAPFQGDQVSLEYLPPPDSDYSLLLTFIYGGRVVGEAQVQSLDCRLVAEPSGSQCGMEQVVFPKPDPREPTQRLLSQIERGVLVASNSRGLFVQRLCPIPVSWNAPQAPPGPGPHLLPSNECVELFRTNYFCRDLARYFQGLGPPPKFQVTLNFWEESPSPNHTPKSLITVQMEQAFARHLLEETPEEQAATLSLLQSLGDPSSSSPLCSSYLL